MERKRGERNLTKQHPPPLPSPAAVSGYIGVLELTDKNKPVSTGRVLNVPKLNKALERSSSNASVLHLDKDLQRLLGPYVTLYVYVYSGSKTSTDAVVGVDLSKNIRLEQDKANLNLWHAKNASGKVFARVSALGLRFAKTAPVV